MRTLTIAVLLMVISMLAHAETWSTAVSKNGSNGTSIIFRYIQKFDEGFKKDSQPVRIIITWEYQGSNGMPSSIENQRMVELEDVLQPAIEANKLSTLALVSTGNNLKEWIYYSKSEEQFFNALNSALGKLKPFPIKIHVGTDPGWKSYNEFISQVKNG